jgi:2-methylcitrate dehydratase PrpD
VASRLLRLDRNEMQSAIGLVGSMSSGISEAFADGTWSHLMNAGWGAQAGIAAALVARTGFTGPATVIEGCFGLFRSHLQDPTVRFDFDRLTARLGQTWETRKIAPKFYPCAHVIHPFLDCVLDLARQHDLAATRIDRVTCFIADWMVPVVCTPVAEKRRPLSDFQARTSLQYSLAEALYRRSLDASAYDETSLRNAEILALADRVDYAIDERAPASSEYKGWVRIDTSDGRQLERIVVHGDHDPGAEIAAKLREKFDRCLAVARRSEDADEIAAAIAQLDQADSVAGLIEVCSRRVA